MLDITSPFPVILPKTHKNGLALYIHWPWCLKKCPYCDFNAHVNENRDESLYLSCVLKELECVSELVSKRLLTSIFFGGGTPSLASTAFVEAIINKAFSLFEYSNDTEVTLEVNPSTYKPSLFHDFVTAGINRFSIGIQSFYAKDLAFLGRNHTAFEAEKTLEAALLATHNVSADFIYGLPKQSLSQWKKQLKKAIAVGTNHLSAYQLTIEPGTAFFGAVRKKEWRPMDNDRQADFFQATHEIIAQNNFYAYEVSNFARIPKKDTHATTNNSPTPLPVCRHNLHVWRYGDYAGVGAGAHGRITNEKGEKWATRNFRMPNTYIKEVNEKNCAFFEKFKVSGPEASQEAILTGIRLSEGVRLPNGSKWSEILNYEEAVCMEKAGFLKLSDEYLTLTAKGVFLLDSILERLFR